MIHGVEIKELVTHADERGFFREVIRASDAIFPEGFGQWSHTMSYPGTAKAWHVHQKQIDWWYVAVGTIKAALYDLPTDDRPTLFGYILGLGGRDVTPDTIDEIIERTRSADAPEREDIWVGVNL